LSLNEITEHFQIDRSSVFRLLGTLLKHGYVKQDVETKKYSLGFKILELSGALSEQIHLESQLHSVIDKVSLATKQNTHLAVLDGSDVVFIAVEQPTTGVTVNIPVGTREPSALTALGRAILPFISEEKQNIIIRDLGVPVKKVKSILEKAKEEKIAFDNEEFKKGIICMAAPVFNHRKEIVCSIGISGHAEIMKSGFNEFTQIVKKAGADASVLLGCKDQGE